MGLFYWIKHECLLFYTTVNSRFVAAKNKRNGLALLQLISLPTKGCVLIQRKSFAFGNLLGLLHVNLV